MECQTFEPKKPDLRAEEAAAVLADQLGRENALAAVGFAECLSPRNLRLHMIPLVRLDDGFMAAFHIILRDFPFVALELLLQEVHGKGLLEKRVTFVLLVLENAHDRGLAPSAAAAG